MIHEGMTITTQAAQVKHNSLLAAGDDAPQQILVLDMATWQFWQSKSIDWEDQQEMVNGLDG